MDRRGFLKAIVAVPAVVYAAKGAFIALPPPFNIRREISKRLDIDAWQVYYCTPIGAYEYEFATLINVPCNKAVPAERLAFADNQAWLAFQHAQKRYEA